MNAHSNFAPRKRERWGRRPELDERIITLWQRGRTQQQIAIKLNLTNGKVAYRIKVLRSRGWELAERPKYWPKAKRGNRV